MRLGERTLGMMSAVRSILPRGRTPKHIVFVGPPQSGKTVYFAAVVDRLTRQSSEYGAKLSLHAANMESMQFVDDVVDNLSRQVWPPEGGAKEAHGTLEYHLKKKGWLWSRQSTLRCCDFAGEAFQGAFGDQKVASVDVSSDLIAKLKEDIEYASGVFYVVDAIKLHHGKCRVTRDCLFGLANELRKQRKPVGIIFTKRDVFDGQAFEPQEKLRREYPDAWAKLSEIRAQCFFVSSIGETVVNNDGERVPPKGYTSDRAKHLLEPINWMLGIRTVCAESEGDES